MANPGEQVRHSRSTIEKSAHVARWHGKLQGLFKGSQGLFLTTKDSFGLCAENVDGEEAAKKALGLGKLLQVGQERVRLGMSILRQQQASKGEILPLPCELRRIVRRQPGCLCPARRSFDVA